MPRASSLPSALGGAGDRAAARIFDLLDRERKRWGAVDPHLDAPLRALRGLVAAGGKRIRPAFCFWAFVGAGGDPDDPRVVDACAAIEMVHASALVHDDVIDDSSTRRGRPSVHHTYADLHETAGLRGNSRRFGDGVAIVVGDLALVYADLLFPAAPACARAVFNDLRLEMCVGQHLDLVGGARRDPDRAAAERIEVYKSGKYTVERPLHLGAALAGRLDELAAPLTAYGLPLGRAFQLRDDVLGVFGEPAVTGKPTGDDLREGKLTSLLTAAWDAASPGRVARLRRIGASDLDADEVASLQQLLVDTGALHDVEASIGRLVDEAVGALGDIPLSTQGRDALESLATFVARRVA